MAKIGLQRKWANATAGHDGRVRWNAIACRGRNRSGTSVVQTRYSFSLAGYLLSVAAGCAVFASALSVALGYGAPMIVVFTLVGVMVGLLPGMLLFLPVVLLSIWLGNRFNLQSWLYAGAFGAAGGATYYLAALAALGGSVGASPWLASILAAAGAVAGCIYFFTERVDREGRTPPTKQDVLSPVPER